MKIARHATGRPAVVVFDHAYHGRTNLTMALTAKNMPYKHRFGPFAGEIYRVPMSYPLRDGGLSGADAAARAIDLIEKQVGADNVAAVLIEPIQGEGGFVVPAPGFLPALSAWATRGRRGVHRRRDPDRLLPYRRLVRLRARGRRARPDHDGQGHRRRAAAGRRSPAGPTIMDAVHVGGLGGTYGGNPVACAAALASIETMRELDLAAAARRIGAVMRPAGSGRSPRADPRIAEVRGRGAMLAVEISRRPARSPRTRRRTAAVVRGLPRGRAADAHLRHVRQRAAVPAARW